MPEPIFPTMQDPDKKTKFFNAIISHPPFERLAKSILKSARNKILRDTLTATCDGGTFWRASEFEKRNATRKKKENDDGTR